MPIMNKGGGGVYRKLGFHASFCFVAAHKLTASAKMIIKICKHEVSLASYFQ